jgi:hypothetical protein
MTAINYTKYWVITIMVNKWQKYQNLKFSIWVAGRLGMFCIFCMTGKILFSQPQIHRIFPPQSGIGTTIIDPVNYPGILPGDEVLLMAGNYHQILIRDIHGLPGEPVIFRNEGGRVIIRNEAHYGISVRNCSYFDFAGNGDSDFQYGICIKKVERGAGISFEKLSTNFSISFFEISNTKLSAIIAKSDPNCTFESLRENFTMKDVIIHSNYIHDVESEALYVGHTYYNGTVLNCNDADTLVLPHVIEGVYVYNNIISRTGRNAIQISSAYADCSIYDNIISYDSQLETYNQMGGIIIGGGSVCDCYNNHIANGKGSGIEVFGRGNFLIFNNLIENPGRTHKPDTLHSFFPKHGIFIKDVSTDPGATIGVFHNTIIYPKSDGILFTNTSLAGSYIQNNIIVGPGSFEQIGTNAFIHNKNVDLVISNNLLLNSAGEGCFSDHFESDYSLRQTSKAIDKGTDLSSFGITFDMKYLARPMGNGYDIGAFEFNPLWYDDDLSQVSVFPNPFFDRLTLSFCRSVTSDLTIHIYSITGRLVFKKSYPSLSQGAHEITIEPEKIETGIFILRLTSANLNHNSLIIKL